MTSKFSNCAFAMLPILTSQFSTRAVVMLQPAVLSILLGCGDALDSSLLAIFVQAIIVDTFSAAQMGA